MRREFGKKKGGIFFFSFIGPHFFLFFLTSFISKNMGVFLFFFFFLVLLISLPLLLILKDAKKS